MNEFRIAEKAKVIANRRAALKWLEEYGKGLTESGAADVTVALHYAGGCQGAAEAREVLSTYGRFSLPEILKAAVECCQNDITASIDAIRKELATVDADQN